MAEKAEKKLTAIRCTRTTFAEGKLVEKGDICQIPADISEKAAKDLIIYGKALPVEKAPSKDKSGHPGKG